MPSEVVTTAQAVIERVIAEKLPQRVCDLRDKPLRALLAREIARAAIAELRASDILTARD